VVAVVAVLDGLAIARFFDAPAAWVIWIRQAHHKFLGDIVPF